VTAKMVCRLIGRWRILAADIWARDCLDPCRPATLDIRADGHGEIASAPSRQTPTSPTAIRTSLWIKRGSSMSTRSEAPGRPNSSKSGSLEIEFDRHHGDDAILTAEPASSSAAC